ncbi:MAG: hypothetical protein AAF564_25290 [Bacteroidota bacterium]
MPIYKIPLPVYVLAAVVVVSGLMGGYAGLVNPGLFFGFMGDVDWSANNLPFLNGLWGTRNLSLVLMMVAGVILRNPSIMFTVFTVRTLTEIQDMFLLAPNTLDPSLMAPVSNPTFFDQFMAVFPFIVLASELAGAIWLGSLLFGKKKSHAEVG